MCYNHCMKIDLDLAYQEALEKWDKPEVYPPATVIHFLSIIIVEFKIGEKNYDAFIEDPEGNDAFVYILNTGYLGIVNKLIKFPSLNKDYLSRLNNIKKLMHILFKLSDKCRLNLLDFVSRAQAKKCLNMMYQESAALLIIEINTCDFADKLKSLEGDVLTQYIKFIIDFEETHADIEFLPTFKEILKKILS